MVGHSGCGKSTLLNIVAGLETASSGGVVLEGREVRGAGRDRMVVFQNFSLMPWLSVFQNVRLAVRAAFPAWSRAQVREWTQRYVDMVGLAGAEAKRPAALSGGMRQRVGLARAFIQEELVRMWTAMRNTVFMVTHDVDEAILLSDRIALMTNGPDARLAEIVEVKLPRPRSRASIIDDPEYGRLRSHIIHFLVERSRQIQEQHGGAVPVLARDPVTT